MKKKSSNIILGLIYFFVGMVLSILPFVIDFNSLYPYITSKTLVFIFLADIITILYLLLIFLDESYRPKKNYILYSFLSFVLINILSSGLGVYPAISFWSNSVRADGTILILHIFLFFLVTAFTVKSKKILHTLIWSSVVASFFVTLSIYVGMLNFGGISKMFKHGGSFGNDSYASVYLLFNLFFILYLFLKTNTTKKVRYLLGAIFVFVVMSPIFFNFDIFRGIVSFGDIVRHPMLVLGNSRGATISLILGIICTSLFLLMNNEKKVIRNSSKITTIVFFSSVFLIILLLFIPSSKINKWFMKETGGYRAVYWHQAWEGFKNRPILGWGSDNFSFVNQQYFNPGIFCGDYEMGEIYSDKAHNVVFDTLINSGILGFLAYLGILISASFTLWKSKNMPYHAKAVLFGLIFAYVLQNLIFFDFSISYIMFAFLLAMIVIFDHGTDNVNFYKKESKNNLTGIPLKILLVVLIATLIIVVKYFAFMPFKKIHEDFRYYNQLPEVRGSVSYDSNLSPFGEREDRIIYASYVVSQYLNTKDEPEKSILYLTDIDRIIKNIEKPHLSDQQIFLEYYFIFRLYETRYRFSNDDISTLNKLKEYSQKEIILSPNDPRGYLDYGHFLFYEKKYAAALDVIEKALVACPHNYGINKTLVEIAKRTGDKKIIEREIKQAEINLPGINFH